MESPGPVSFLCSYVHGRELLVAERVDQSPNWRSVYLIVIVAYLLTWAQSARFITAVDSLQW